MHKYFNELVDIKAAQGPLIAKDLAPLRRYKWTLPVKFEGANQPRRSIDKKDYLWAGLYDDAENHTLGLAVSVGPNYVKV